MVHKQLVLIYLGVDGPLTKATRYWQIRGKTLFPNWGINLPNERFSLWLAGSCRSFRSGNANVRLCVSCANVCSWHSYELEPLRTLRSTTVIGKNKVVLEVRRSWSFSQSETFPGEGIHSCITCTRTIHGWAASLIRESACIRYNGLNSTFLRRPAKAPCKLYRRINDVASQWGGVFIM